MADRNRASSLSVLLTREDLEWLAECAEHEDASVHELVGQAVRHFRYWQAEGEEALREALEIFEAERSDREAERQRRRYFQREYEAQSRRLHEMLRDERHRRWEQESQLRDERDRRIACEKQLRDEHKLRVDDENQLRESSGGNKRQAKAARAYRSALYDPTVAKLLALAIYSESDSEATAAFEKARSLHQDRRSDSR